MSRNSSFERSDGCPQCGGDLRPVTPLSPELDAYQCDECGHKSRRRGDG